jgi:DNA repair protein RadA/Sms
MDQDVFLNVVGGVRVMETSADLALIVAIISSFKNRVVDARLITFGEVGLAGEVRPVPNGQDRLREAAKHGFTKAIVPKANAPKQTIEGLEVIAVSRISEVVDAI